MYLFSLNFCCCWCCCCFHRPFLARGGRGELLHCRFDGAVFRAVKTQLFSAFIYRLEAASVSMVLFCCLRFSIWNYCKINCHTLLITRGNRFFSSFFKSFRIFSFWYLMIGIYCEKKHIYIYSIWIYNFFGCMIFIRHGNYNCIRSRM